MTTFISLPTLMALVLGASSYTALAASRSAAAPKLISKRFDFAGKPQSSFSSFGINVFFSDVPADQVVNGRDLSAFPGDTLPERLISELGSSSAGHNNENLYQLTQVYDRLDSKVSGQVIAYHNRSDDTDVNFQIVVGKTAADRLKPNTSYQITAKIDFFTNVSAELFGIGGSADSNSFGLAVSQNPWVSKIAGSDLSQPSNPDPTDEALDSYYGLAASFFVEKSELAELALAAYDSLSEDELALLGSNLSVAPSRTKEYKAALVKVLTSLYAKVLSTLPKIDDSSELNAKISAQLDLVIKDKLNAMSDEEKQELKDMFGAPADPSFLLAAAPESSSEMLRTSTLDSQGHVMPLGVPSGSCTTGAPLASLPAKNRWICERYSYMGRINNGLDASDNAGKLWAANSVSTKVPLEFKTDASGQPLYLNLNSHSGFEGLSVYYVTGIAYTIVEKK